LRLVAAPAIDQQGCGGAETHRTAHLEFSTIYSPFEGVRQIDIERIDASDARTRHPRFGLDALDETLAAAWTIKSRSRSSAQVSGLPPTVTGRPSVMGRLAVSGFAPIPHIQS